MNMAAPSTNTTKNITEAKKQLDQLIKCPRCDSTNTKFCYYNNYSLSQPRHFCKACKRYWTRGGALRSVPVGGGCRKNKKVKKHVPSVASTGPVAPSDQIFLPPSSSSAVNPNSDLDSFFYDMNLASLNSSIQQSTDGFLSDCQGIFPSSASQAAMIPNLGFMKDVNVEDEKDVLGGIIDPFESFINAASSSSSSSSVAAGEYYSSYLYWNPAIGGAPLF